MSRRHLLVLVTSLLALAGCNPTFNWREVQFKQDADLKALLPCKPDQGSRALSLLEQTVTLSMMGCEAGDALFAIAYTDLPRADLAAEGQRQWQAVMLGNMKAASSQPGTLPIKGAIAPPPVSISAQGRRQDGRAVSARAVWFARGGRLYHAAVYADRLDAEVSHTFFTGLRLE